MNHVLLLDLPGDAERCVKATLEADPTIRLQQTSISRLGAEANRTAWSIVLVSLDSEASDAGIKAIEFCYQNKIPCIAVVDRTSNSELRLAAYEAGVLDCVDLPGQASRMRLKVSLCLARSTVLSQELARKLAAAPGADAPFNPIDLTGLMSRLTRVAPLGSTILLNGETGVGKTTIAQWIHNQSARQKQPFAVVPCAAIPATLMENELFGHARGAFTSADQDCEGQLAAAGQGTLLLDEIDSLPLEVQGKLLRVVEQRTYTPVGASKSRRFDARLIVATNKDLQAEVEAGRFRADLYFRLCIMSFCVPSLRERPEAIVPLAKQYCQKFAKEHDRPVEGLSPEAARALTQYGWPGNIRELRNSMDYAVAMAAGGQVHLSDLPAHILSELPSVTAFAAGVPGPGPEESATALQTVRSSAERNAVAESLTRNGQNRTRTARELGISRTALYKKLTRLGLAAGDSGDFGNRAFA